MSRYLVLSFARHGVVHDDMPGVENGEAGVCRGVGQVRGDGGGAGQVKGLLAFLFSMVPKSSIRNGWQLLGFIASDRRLGVESLLEI